MDIPAPNRAITVTHGSKYHARFTSIIFKLVKSKLMLVSAWRQAPQFQQSVLDIEWILLILLAADRMVLAGRLLWLLNKKARPQGVA
jgi:hypothetical protein